MKIVVFGTGYVGSALVRELTDRGHEVTAVSRSEGPDLPAKATLATGSVHDQAFVASVTSGADVIVSALPALGPDGGLGVSVAELARAAETGTARLGIVGGAGVVPVRPGGPRQGDTPDFPARLVPLVDAHQHALDMLGAAPANLDWFYLAPAAEFSPFDPGTRTGAYRTSGTALVVNEQGRSFLGVADYAIAFADELETPRTHRAWLAVGY